MRRLATKGSNSVTPLLLVVGIVALVAIFGIFTFFSHGLFKDNLVGDARLHGVHIPVAEQYVHPDTCVDKCAVDETGCAGTRRWYCGENDADECRDKIFVTCSHGCAEGTCKDLPINDDSEILVGAWFYDGWYSKTPGLSEACEDKQDPMEWVFDATPREVDYVYKRQNIPSQGYDYSGVVAYLPKKAAETKPLYRLRHNGHHQYTTNETQKDEWIAEGGVLEGVLGYVYENSFPGRNRFFAPMFMGDTQQLTTDDHRAWKLLKHNMTSTIQGYVYNTSQQNTTALYEFIKYQPGEELPRTPFLGPVHSDDQQVMDQYISWASDDGIDFFAFEFFWKPTPGCPPTRKQKALDTAFLTSTSDKDLDFVLGWFPSSKYIYTQQTVSGAFDYMLANYFTHPRYLKIDNKPVLYIAAGGIAGDLGGWDEFKDALDAAQQKAIDAGFDGIYVINIEVGPDPYGPAFDTGMSGSTAFGYNNEIPNFEQTDNNRDAPGVIRYQEYLNGFANSWPKHAQNLADIDPNLNFVPDVGAGWDRTVVPWLRYRSHIAINNNPELWKEQLERAKTFVENNPNSDPKIVMITAWNEWSEGQIIEPDNIHGTAYIDAVGDVFGK